MYAIQMLRRRRMRQLALPLPRRGGRRDGAGRPRKDGRAIIGMPHLRRPALAARHPVHATWRMRHGVWNLRTRRCFSVLARAFWKGCDRFGFRLVHYSVQGNHLHLLVEAEDQRALARGMKGLGVRIARGLNRVMRRRGAVLDDRYHGHVLRTPTEVRRARHYLLRNAGKHYGLAGPDPYASTAPLVVPATFLLRLLR